MTWMMYLKKAIFFSKITSHHFQPKKCNLFQLIIRAGIHNRTKASTRDSLLDKSESMSSFYDKHTLHHSPLFSRIGDQSNDYKIDIVDDETWQVSTGFADVWKDADTGPEVVSYTSRDRLNDESQNNNDPDFDDIDDLRVCGKLFYKLDRDSKEYEENNFDFHRRKKSSKTKTKETPSNSNSVSDSNRKDGNRENKTQKTPKSYLKMEETCIEKKQRVPTFNQVTAPYHEPFCLDIYISKASVRACIVHRATSKVVVVAHSISKDMKFDLGSTRNVAACDAVGKVLAQRALADDIHNVVYTPRKGEKLEGKLQSVLQSLMNNGVLVKVKLKQKKVRKTGFQSAEYKHR
ncbi:uncharacterized protein [Rutidosis leptorrhynchoides]|uniref:uncharacterized protein n=1 Tax=Rutidosis leptorrhynchoides TaxID=125765 RepID=UPI003A993FC6